MKKQISEIFWLRSVACLSVVLIHALSLVIVNYYAQGDTAQKVLQSLQLTLMYGTPMFVFISEFLLSYSYRQTIPKGFFKKRFQFIFLPYLIVGVLYAVYFQHQNGLESVLSQIKMNVIDARYHGYFVIIIFQFYVLHALYQKIERWIPMKVAIIGALMINVAYLGVVNFMDPAPFNISPVTWNIQSRLPFVGWIFYFIVGFYAGRHYNEFKAFVIKYAKLNMLLLLGSASVIVWLYWSETLVGIHSKRVDVMFLTTFMILFLFYVATKMQRVPKLFITISQYSFGIYLLHPLVQSQVMPYIKQIPSLNNPFTATLLLLVGGVGLSMLLTYAINLIPIGKYMIGKVNVRSKRQSSRKQQQAA
ncbi:acyltransferase family protein [Bacillus sp. CGMCC 1.16541]|uniref:acyltransferase family protein n=1 Tax=Bacillus sp. CGMCC 1.16541 TaxID=2185143 RepID=UPI0013A57180|nr:acyltransferase family protein [Bacillus sp. CGMCC 1.16541]